MAPWLSTLGIESVNAGVFDGSWHGSGLLAESVSPIDGKVIAKVQQATASECELAITRAQEAFARWRVTPAPVRGETIRRLGNALREVKSDLAKLVTLEMGKI